MSISYVVIKTLLLPPAINFIIIVIALCLKSKKTLSRLFLYSGALSLVLFCLPFFSHLLLKKLELYPPLSPPVSINQEQAIVVLSGGSYKGAREYGKDVDGFITLQRNHYAAFLQKQTDLPVLVTGGNIELIDNSEASVMADTLTNSFNVEVTWSEDKSRNTAENAIYSATILKNNNIDSIYLVTHAWHMPRAVMLFEQQGLNITPAPTIFTSDKETFSIRDILPSAAALFQTRIALHEYLGIVWYKLRYR